MTIVKRVGPGIDAWHDRCRRIDMMGLSLDAISEAQTVALVLDRLACGRGGWIVTQNVDMLRRTNRDSAFRQLVSAADLVVADGMPLVWASRLSGQALPERVAGSSLVTTLSAAAAAHRRSVYLLGGAPGSAQQAARILQSRFAALRIVGVDCPPFGFERDEQAINAIGRRIEAAEPDIIYVALGSPKQEQLIARLRIAAPRAWWIGVGISFSFLCGQVRRAPLWMQRAGLEWLHRLAQEPRRLARRYLLHGLPFACRLFLHAACARCARHAQPG